MRYLAQPTRLRDGRSAWIREVRTDDQEAISRFVSSLSPSSRYFRFMMGMRELSADALWHVSRPQAGKEAVLVSTPGDSLGKITGIAQFVIDPDGNGCEFALVVDDGWQRQGLGSMLMSELVTLAARHGVSRIHAEVLNDNHAMQRLAEKTGCELRHDLATPFVLQLSRRLPGLAPAAIRAPARTSRATPAVVC